tara:strand:- start:387 stop:611 length:225 start_codon:yes stop_codon:yes gene_type:complete
MIKQRNTKGATIMTIYNNDSPDNIDAMINNKNQKSKYEDDNLDTLLKEFDIEDADIDVDIATNDEFDELEIFDY